jgi:hypothetical protein
MVTKIGALLAFAGLVTLTGCNKECCNDGDGYRNDGDQNRIIHSSADGSMASPNPMVTSTNYYDNSANTYAEGTVSTVGADGRITFRGYETPYANSYTSYHRDYYALPEAERQTRSKDILARYKDRLNYSEYKDKERDYNFSISSPERFTVYDESSRYGRSADGWNYSSPRTYHYNEIKAGDRVVIGYDSNNPSSVRSMYRVEAVKK